jgi:L-ascorbate metabolism protein UlaG (beta-lactamase superfamily)
MGTYSLTGMPLGFVIQMENAKSSVYFAGDTCVYGDMKLYSEMYPCKIGMFGIDSVPGHAFAMNGSDAAMAAKLYNVETAIPMHYVPGSSQVELFKSELKKIAPGIIPMPMAAGDILEF